MGTSAALTGMVASPSQEMPQNTLMGLTCVLPPRVKAQCSHSKGFLISHATPLPVICWGRGHHPAAGQGMRQCWFVLQVLVMDDGHVAEFDTPAALIAKRGGIFRAMVLEAGLTDDLDEPLDLTSLARQLSSGSAAGTLPR